MGLVDTLWCSVRGIAYKQACAISRLLKVLLGEAGIPAEYTAYSIRHALITALFDMNLSEVEVNAYTGHSNNAHTALTHYFHLDGKWVGAELAAGTRVPVSQTANEQIERDNKALQSAYHEGEEETEEKEE